MTKLANLLPAVAKHEPVLSHNKGFAQRVGVFVDVQNMFYSAKKLKQSKLNYGTLLRDIVGERQLVRAVAYIMQRSDVNQQAFQEALTHFGYDLRIQEMKVRPGTDGQSTTKGSWDVGMSLEVMALADKLDTIVLVTGDSDYLPLVNALRQKGCRTELVSFTGATSGDLISAVDQFIVIPDSWIFEEKNFKLEPGNARPHSNESQNLGPTSGRINPNDLPRDDYEDSLPAHRHSSFNPNQFANRGS